MAFQFLVDGGKIWGRMNPSAGRGGPFAEQELVEFLIAELFRQGPADSGGPGQFQIAVL